MSSRPEEVDAVHCTSSKKEGSAVNHVILGDSEEEEFFELILLLVRM